MTSRQLESLLLHGTKHRQAVDLSQWDGPLEVLVRPLNASEASEVELEMMTGMKASATVNGASVNAAPVIDDLGTLMEAQRMAKVKAVAYALSHSGENCDLEQAKGLPSTWIDELARVVYRISGLQSGDDDSFRVSVGVDGTGQVNGGDDAGLGPSGNTPGAEPAGANQAPTQGPG